MAIVSVAQPYNMLADQDWGWQVTAATATSLTISDGVHTQTYAGTFSYDFAYNVSGTVTTSRYYLNGTLMYSAFGMTASAAQMQKHAETFGDTQATYAYALSGSDSITGSYGNDVLLGYAGNDALVGGSGNDSLSGGAGNDRLNGGAGNDRLNGGAGNDLLNGGTSADTMQGGAGNDIYYADNTGDKIYETTSTTSAISMNAGGTDKINSSISFNLSAYTGVSHVEHLTLIGSSAINGTGNKLANTLTGNGAANVLRGVGANDTLVGGSGADTLYGDAGNDMLRGSPGNDILYGGTGQDIFRFDSALSTSAIVSRDQLSDFSAVDDTIQLENSVFTKLGVVGILAAGNFKANTAGRATDNNDYVVYESDTGRLFYDADGSGAGVSVQIATLTGAPPLAHADIFVT